MAPLRVYLAGPILHEEDFGKTWRERVTTEYQMDDIEWVNPLDLVGENTDAPPETWDVREIVEEDMDALAGCDILLVKWELAPMAGTPMEVFYANHDLGLPVVTISDHDVGDLSPWIQYFTDDFAPTVDDAVKMIQSEARSRGLLTVPDPYPTHD